MDGSGESMLHGPEAPSTVAPARVSVLGLPTVLSDIYAHTLAMRRHVVEFNLDQLAEQALACETRSAGLLRTLEGLSARGATVGRSGTTATSAAIAALIAHAKAPDAREFFSSVHEHLAETDGDAASELREELEALGTAKIRGSEFLKLARRLASTQINPYAEETHAALVGIARGTLGSVLVEFEQGVLDALPTVTKKHAEFYIALLERELSAFVSRLDDGLLNVFKSMASGDGAIAAARDAAATIPAHLYALARLQGMAYRSAVVARRAGRGTKAEELGHLLARAGHACREAIAMRVSAERVVVELSSEAPSATVQKLVDTARTRPFHATPPRPRHVELNRLSEVDNGEEVEISGFVLGIRVVRKDSGPLNVVALGDPSSRATALLAAFFAHLPHAGVARGAYVRAGGTYRTSSSMLDEQPGLDVGRVSLAQAAHTSWRLEFLRTARRWFQPYRGSLDLIWSLGRQGTTADRQGAAELVFSPTERR